MNGWTLAKFAMAMVGLALVLVSDTIHRPWVGYIGLGILFAAFMLRFVQRRFDPSRKDPPQAD